LDPATFQKSTWAQEQISLFTSSNMATKIIGKEHIAWVNLFYEFKSAGRLYDLPIPYWHTKRIEAERARRQKEAGMATE